ncbi:MAG: inorganic phosphate transporter [Candidatus Heimdallarchaeaceae archaeon]
MIPIIIILLILMVILAFGIGANDETMATVVGSRALKVKHAIFLGAGLVFLGVVFLSANVGKTIGANLLSEKVDYNIYMMFAIIISTTIWLIVASRTGAPISTTHSVVGSVFGVAIIWSISEGNKFLDSLNWRKMGDVALGWVISPILGFVGAYLCQLLVSRIIVSQQEGLNKLEKLEKGFMYLLIIAVSWTQISRGGNDSANALGIMYGLIESGDFSPDYVLLMTIITGVVLALGLLIVGRNVIKNVGRNLIEMRPSDAFSIQISTSIVIFLATILGLPVSGSHILIFAVIGAGRVKGERPDKKSFRKMVLSWVITFPVAAILAAICYILFIIF